MNRSPEETERSDIELEQTGDGLRDTYFVAAIAASFFSKFAPLGPLTDLARYYGHDAALAFGGYMVLRSGSRLSRGLIIFAACSAAEVLQLLIKAPGRRLPFLGTFDWWDFVAYGVGIAIAVLLDVTTLKTEETHAPP